MPARCRIDLTELEAAAVLHVIGNSMDDLDHLFTDEPERRAAVRARDKIARAKSEKFPTTRSET